MLFAYTDESLSMGVQNHVGDFASFAGGYYLARGARGSEGGRLAVSALVGGGAALWALALAKGELWKVKD